jgi:hypothetical protein
MERTVSGIELVGGFSRREIAVTVYRAAISTPMRRPLGGSDEAHQAARRRSYEHALRVIAEARATPRVLLSEPDDATLDHFELVARNAVDLLDAAHVPVSPVESQPQPGRGIGPRMWLDSATGRSAEGQPFGRHRAPARHPPRPQGSGQRADAPLVEAADMRGSCRRPLPGGPKAA